MIAYHGDNNIKKKYVARVLAHRRADEIIKGVYWERGKGCAVGCTIHSGDHGAFETELGIPRILARLEDGIFEALPNDLAQTWPERFLKAIKPGADLSQVWPKFAYWLLNDPKNGVIRFAKTNTTKIAIENVGNLYLRSLKEEVSRESWLEVRNYAADAASAAASYASAAASAAASYAASAAAAADYAAVAADYASAAAAADYSADARSRIKQSEKLLELLKDATVKRKRKMK